MHNTSNWNIFEGKVVPVRTMKAYGESVYISS